MLWTIHSLMISSIICPRACAFMAQGSRFTPFSNRWARRYAVSTHVEGVKNSTSFRLVFRDDDKNLLSPWHDIPLYKKNGFLNFITEIPKFSKAKMEIDTSNITNPIKQDMKNGLLRDYHGPIYWNYGCLPQTWENPNEFHDELKCYGDNDPLDVVEIGSTVLTLGSITSIKPLGIFAMIDDGELDWKLIAISTNDPLSNQLNDVADIEKLLPGTISGIREWFRWYKTPDYKPLNQFGYNETCLDVKKAIEIIQETHHSWKELKAGHIDPNGLSLK